MEAGATTLQGRCILIATGAAPVSLGIAGEELLTTSDRFLELERLPRRIALVGGGYIAAEFAHIAARAGAKVTILQQGERILPQFDGDLVRLLQSKSSALGIEIRIGAKVEAIEKGAHGLRAVIGATGDRAAVTADLIVHAAGRRPDVEPLDLAAGGVEHQGHRLGLNDFLQSTSNPAVYAAGDAASRGPPLTPVAGYDGGVSGLLPRIHESSIFELAHPGRGRCGINMVPAEDVPHRKAARQQVIGDDPPVAPPPDGLRTHDGAAVLAGKTAKLRESGAERLRRGIVGIRAEGGVLPVAVR